MAETLLGRESAVATVTRALALREAAADRRVLAQPLFQAAVHWWWTDALATAHDTLVQLLQRTSSATRAPLRVLVLLGQVECALGDLESALARALKGRRRQSSPVSKPSWRTTSRSRASSRRIAGEQTRPGRLHSARWTSCPKLAAALPSSATGALGHLELALDAPDAAVALLRPVFPTSGARAWSSQPRSGSWRTSWRR